MTDIKAILVAIIIDALIKHSDKTNARRLWLAIVIDETSGQVLTHKLSTNEDFDKAINSALAKAFKVNAISKSNIDQRKNNVAKFLTADPSLNSTALTEWANKFGITLRFGRHQMGSVIKLIFHNMLMPDTNRRSRNILNPKHAIYTLQDINALVNLKIQTHNNTIVAEGRGRTELSPH